MQEIGLMERFADPALFGTLSMGEKAAGGLITTLMGMGTTFVILILLWGVTVITSNVIRGFEERARSGVAAKAAEKVAPATKADASAGVTSAAAETAAASQSLATAAEAGGELIAVLMAAIAASSGSDAVNNLKIRKIERISGYRPVWNSAGSSDCIESRKF